MRNLKHLSNLLELLNVDVVVDDLVSELLLDQGLHDGSQLLARAAPGGRALYYHWSLAVNDFIPLFH